MHYLINRVEKPVELGAAWDSADWNSAQVGKISNFFEAPGRSSDHKPNVEFKLQYGKDGFYGLYKVKDKYVRSVVTEFNGSVCRDSCVEFFVEPAGGQGYLNFEFNCGGSFLVYCIRDCSRTENGFKDYRPLTAEDAAMVKVFHTMPEVVDPEIAEDTEWRLGFFIPFKLFEKYFGNLGALGGRKWRANFYKCGDSTSHPHWASWAPVSELNFHLPQCFQTIEFAD